MFFYLVSKYYHPVFYPLKFIYFYLYLSIITLSTTLTTTVSSYAIVSSEGASVPYRFVTRFALTAAIKRFFI